MLRCGGRGKGERERLNSPPWLPAPEIHISCRTRVLLAPERCHSKLRVGEGESLSKAVSHWFFSQSNRGRGRDPVQEAGLLPRPGITLSNRTTRNVQQHRASLQSHNQAFQRGEKSDRVLDLKLPQILHSHPTSYPFFLNLFPPPGLCPYQSPRHQNKK